jgi:hypothetical protein
MNFRSLLIILYLFLIQNSEALSEGVTDLIRGTPRVLEYAPRTPRDVDTRTRALRIRKQWRFGQYAPRTPRLQPPINRMRGFRVFLPIPSRFRVEALRKNPRSYPEVPVSYSSPEASPEIPKIPRSAVPESKLCPREVRFSRRSSRSAEEYYFYKP